LASLASIYIHELDDVLPSHISNCLFNSVRKDEFWIHNAALDCSGVLSLNFAEANRELTALLQQFLTTPSPIFGGADYKLIQSCAVERLAQNLNQPSAGENVALSTVYALLNTLYSYNTASKDKAAIQEQSAKIQENIVAAISKIACVLKGDKV